MIFVALVLQLLVAGVKLKKDARSQVKPAVIADVRFGCDFKVISPDVSSGCCTRAAKNRTAKVDFIRIL